jgi:hypothetical protein
MEKKQYLSHLKLLVNTPKQWEAFNGYVESSITSYQRRLEQSPDMVEIYKSQGAIEALRKLKLLRDEVNAEK